MTRSILRHVARWSPLLLVGALACGRAGLFPPDVDAGASAAGTDGSSAAGGRAGTAGSAGAAGSTSAGGLAGTDAVAFCANPAACNDLLSMSALAGTCNIVKPPVGEPLAPASWYCECAAGFSVNPRTGRCRGGTACEAAAADSWTVTGDLATSDCSARLTQDCRSLDAATLQFLEQMCHLPPYQTVRLELFDGCVSRYQLKSLVGAMIAPGLEACLQVLRKYRFPCAQPKDCSMVEWDTLP